MRVEGPLLVSNKGPRFGLSARVVVSFVLAALAGALLDTLTRTTWTGVTFGTHVAASSGILFAVGSIVGAIAAVCVLVLGPLPSIRTRSIAVAGAAGVAVYGTAVWIFSGRSLRSGWLAAWGPLGLCLLVALAALATTWLLLRAHALACRGIWGRPVLFALASLGASALLITADLTLFVALYGRIHALLEFGAALGFAASAFVVLTLLSVRAPGFELVVRWAALGAVAWAILFVAIGPLRRTHEGALRHAWREPVYAGRMLRRVQMVEAALGLRIDPAAARSAPLAALQSRFEIQDTTLHPRWRSASVEPPEVERDAARLREGKTDFDIVVYYVDTLRQDVTLDEETMPELARFSRGAMNFRRAYAPGSDTLHSLPGLVGGRYGSNGMCTAALLPTARRSNVRSTLFIPESAYQFLAALLPSFAFETIRRVRDHRGEQPVWGYGADQPTASILVDDALRWLEHEQPARHVTWLFNFDLHNWHGLAREHVDAVAARYGVAEEGAWNWQYRVVARSVDAEFGRLLAGLDRLGRAERTIVLFVSDHGEGLGYQGFWVHSVFLWESLVRVPLLLRVPGHPHVDVDETVSLVDVAPTLSRFLDPHVPTNDCHGIDLLPYLSHTRRPRLPVLLAATSEGQLTKLGMVDGNRKLVLPLDWGEPQLYDLTLAMPDEADVAEHERSRALQLVGEVARSPAFERVWDDEDVQASR